MSLQFETNPLRQGLIQERVADPCIFVIFGATGDLTHRKLIPALYHLQRAGLLPRSFAIVAYAGNDWSDDEYRESIKEWIAKTNPHLPTEGRAWDDFAGLIYYIHRSDDTIESLNRLKSKLAEIDSNLGIGGNYLFYLAIPPFVIREYAEGLGKVGLAQAENGRGWRRLVVEKPFGTDLTSARELNRALQKVFREDQIYRIDHYLGKETVQNILVFRFANQFVEPLLNSKYVDSIQITVAETIGVGSRGAFYDSTGALRDIVQNHILQVLSLVCMDPPSSLDPEAVRDEKLKVFRAIRKIDSMNVDEFVVRGQYGSGRIMGEQAKAYREEKDVAQDSQTETYVAAKFYVDNWRWEGVPFYVRTGKRLAKRVTEIGIQLKDIPDVLFGKTNRDEIHPNVIALNIQPDEGIAILFQAKVPGLTYRIQPVKMDFRYGSAFGASVPDAYERLILDAMLGDPSLYGRADGVEATWEVVEPILEGWQLRNSPSYPYVPGSWGPYEADDFIKRDGRKWRAL